MKHKDNRRYIIEDISSRIRKDMNKQQNQVRRKELNLDQDLKVRRYVRRKVEEYREEGISQEDAVDLILKEKGIVQHFSYLIKNGVDLKQCFMDWTKEPKESKREYSNDGEER